MDVYAPQVWLPHERPTLPGSPSSPNHPTPRRFAFFIIGFIVAITGGLGNALVLVNLPYLQGSLGVYSAEIQWLPAAYVMANVSMNLLLVKFRQQFGLRLFTELFLVIYAVATVAHLFVHGLASAIAVRAAHGMSGAALSTLGLYYVLQAFPAKYRIKAVVLGIGFSQLALPMARLFSSDLMEFGEWRGLYFFELGLALVSLAACCSSSCRRATVSRLSRKWTSSPSRCSRPAWRCCRRCWRWAAPCGGWSRAGWGLAWPAPSC